MIQSPVKSLCLPIPPTLQPWCRLGPFAFLDAPARPLWFEAYRRPLTQQERSSVERFLQRRNGEALFARLVILYEGHTEDAAVAEFCSSHWQSPPPEARGISFINVEGAGGFKAIVPVLDDLGIPWRILVDGDQAGVSGMAGVEAALGRQLAAQHEVIMLPTGQNFEGMLIAAGYQVEIEAGIETLMAPGSSRAIASEIMANPTGRGRAIAITKAPEGRTACFATS